MKDKFEYYDDKIAELHKLLLNAKSVTIKELISKAINLTDESIKTLMQTKAATLVYLSEHKNKTDKKLLEYKEQLRLFSQRKDLLDEMPNHIPEKVTLVNQYLTDVDIFQQRTTFEAQLNETIYETFDKCQAEIEKTLLKFIVKPDNTEFQYNVVKNMICYMISKLQILGFDEISLLSQSSIMSQKLQSINSGDKIIIYIEQYIDVLEMWSELCNSYVRITES